MAIDNTNQTEPIENITPHSENAAPEVSAVSENQQEGTENDPGNAPSFADDEALLAAEAPEFDLGEEHTEETDSDQTVMAPDLNNRTKKELLDIFSEVLAAKPVQTMRRDVEAIKIAFYKIHRAEEDQKKSSFVEAGGNIEEYVPAADAEEQRLKDLFNEYRKRRDEFISNLERSKEDNLKEKQAVIEELKELVNSSETLNNTFNVFRSLQQRWKDAGPVPQANVKDIWETYNHHVENFYNFIKINKELRDLDLKKNYEAKVQLCEEAEALILLPSITSAFQKLQKLHEQWREIGPVSHEHKDAIWERFKEASSRINKQHQDYFDKLKDEQKANLDLKTELCLKVEDLNQSVITTRKEWNDASEKLIEIQKVWKTIGFAPKKDNNRIYERFRTACDRFFEQKREFYGQLKTEMDHNLQLKNELCEAAEALQNSDEWKKTTDDLIALQKQWKEIGPVARRHSDVVWKRFRAACDAFFTRKSEFFSNVDEEYTQNLEMKKALLEEIGNCDFSENGFEKVKEFQRRWADIGFVPIKEKNSIHKQYKALMDKVFAELRSNQQSNSMDRFRGKVKNMKNSGDRRLHHERDRLYNKVKQLQADITLLENNIGFFAKSKNADAMIKDVRRKIEQAKEELAATIEKINLIDNEQ